MSKKSRGLKPIKRQRPRLGKVRNNPCPCIEGNVKKWKNCCGKPKTETVEAELCRNDYGNYTVKRTPKEKVPVLTAQQRFAKLKQTYDDFRKARREGRGTFAAVIGSGVGGGDGAGEGASAKVA